MTDYMAPLVQAYIRAWEAIQREQAAIAGEPNQFRRLRRLRSLEAGVAAILDKLDTYSREFIRSQLPATYFEGAAAAAGVLGVPVVIDPDPIRRLSADLFDDLLTRTQFVRQETKQAIARMLKDEMVRGTIVGESQVKTRQVLTRRLEQIGIRGVRYADGRYHRLDDYAEMAIRTKEAVANNVSGLHLSKIHGVEFYECIDGPDCGLTEHDDPTKASGLIRDFDFAMQYPIAHPRCRRVWTPRPDIRSADDAGRAQPSVSPLQVADQRAADLARRRAQKRRAARVRRDRIAADRTVRRTG